MVKNKSFLLSLCFLCLVLAAAWMVEVKGYGIRINRTESLPYTLFWSKKAQEISRGMIGSIEHPRNPSISIAKIIVGLPGDPIEIKDEKVFVNGCYLGNLIFRSRSGNTYTPQSHKIIPEDYVFLYSPHEESFDSRYQEFGLVETSWIKEELCPIF